MIISSLCSSCLQPFELVLEPSDGLVLKQIVNENGLCPCPRKCGGSINITPDPTISQMARDGRMRQPMVLTGEELYQAVNGLGLPDEIPRTKDTIAALLLAYRVVRMDLEEKSGRFYLNEIELSNGSTIHLTSGLYGCQVLKITKKGQDDAVLGDNRDSDSD